MSSLLPRQLPERPHWEVLQAQAKKLLRACRRGERPSLELMAQWHPRLCGRAPGEMAPAGVALHDTQLVVARHYGFASWSRLKQEVEARGRAVRSEIEQLVEAVWRGRAEEVESAIGARPRWNTEGREKLRAALAGIVNRTVWHRPQYRRIAKELVAQGIECSIWDAARAGLLEHVQELAARDPALLQARDEQGRTPLQRAALIYGSHPECEATVAWMIGQGVEVDIFTAAAYAMPEVVARHLRQDTGWVHRKCQGSVPLNWAVRPRHDNWPAPVETCRLLLGAGSDVESVDEDENGMHPLHHASEWGNRDAIAELLVASGSDLGATDDIGWTPLDYAINRNRTRTIACLKRLGARQTHQDWPNTFGGQRDLMLASVKRGDAAAVQRLLEENPALANAREANGASPLHWASHDGHYEVAALLLRGGADVSAQETQCWGGTPLHWAAEREPAIVELLLDHGAEVNSRNCRTGQTPLHYCARCDDVPEVAEILLARGAEFDARDHKGHTPLDYALRAHHAQVAAFLKARGGVAS